MLGINAKRFLIIIHESAQDRLCVVTRPIGISDQARDLVAIGVQNQGYGQADHTHVSGQFRIWIGAGL